MGKTKKEPPLDPAVKDRLDQILGEITTAQGLGIPPHEILKKTSFDLKENPSLVISLIDALAGMPSSHIAQSLLEMMREARDKKVIKVIKRSLYRLRQKGIKWDEKTTDKKPAFTPPKPAEPEGYLSAIDSSGSRILILARSVPMRGLVVVFSSSQ